MNSAKNLIERMLESESMADLLLLFHQNPGLVDNMEGVARRIGMSAEAVEKDVLDLVGMGFLKMKPVRRGKAISINRAGDRRNQKSMANHILAVK